MANQQLVDYIKGQLQAGVKDDDIKKVLKDAGWPDAEVLDGVSAAKGPIVSSPVAQAASPSMTQATQFAAQSGMGASSGLKINAFGGSISSASSAAVSTSPKVEEKKESVKFDFMSNPTGSKSTGETTTFKPQEAKAESFSPVAAATSAVAAAPTSGKKSLLPWILFIVALVALGVAAPMLYMSGLSAKESATSWQAQYQAVQSQLTSLQGSGADTATQLSALNSEKQDILDELAIFAVPALVPVTTTATTTTSGTSTAPVMQMPTSVEFRVKGIITQDSKGVYMITTPRNIVLTVKNSKDSKVDTTLKPMAGQNVVASISGVHAPMSKDLTVESINGVSVK